MNYEKGKLTPKIQMPKKIKMKRFFTGIIFIITYVYLTEKKCLTIFSEDDDTIA